MTTYHSLVNFTNSVKGDIWKGWDSDWDNLGEFGEMVSKNVNVDCFADASDVDCDWISSASVLNTYLGGNPPKLKVPDTMLYRTSNDLIHFDPRMSSGTPIIPNPDALFLPSCSVQDGSGAWITEQIPYTSNAVTEEDEYDDIVNAWKQDTGKVGNIAKCGHTRLESNKQTGSFSYDSIKKTNGDPYISNPSFDIPLLNTTTLYNIEYNTT